MSPKSFFFQAENTNGRRAKIPGRSKQLEKFLSEILTLYHLAGRYIKENPSIDLNDLGFEYLEAKVASSLAPFLDRNVDNKQLIDFIPYQTESITSPLLAIQCNMFVCSGMVIGLCISHRIVDATVLHKFSDEWAKASRIGIHRVDNTELSFSLALLLPTREMVPESMYVLPLKPGLKTASKTFVFYRLAISSLWTNAENKGLKRLPSRLQFVTTVIWKALKHGKLRPSLIAHMLNLRGRTLLPISDDCCGNPIKPIFIRFFQEMSKSIQLHDLVSLVGDATTKTINECGKIDKGDDLFLMVNYSCREAGEEFERGGLDAYFFTSNCEMPFYPNFSWGKAVRDSHVQSQVEMIVLIGTKVGDGELNRGHAWMKLI